VKRYASRHRRQTMSGETGGTGLGRTRETAGRALMGGEKLKRVSHDAWRILGEREKTGITEEKINAK